MRKIKFRMWDKDEERMKSVVGFGMMEEIPEYGLVESPYGEEYIFYKNDFGDLVSVSLDDCVLMQYTGLKDKNGKEIYEGDIVRFEDEVGEHIGVVIWSKASFVVKTDDYEWLGGLIKGDDYEVIGNIYEHPELLKGDRNGGY